MNERRSDADRCGTMAPRRSSAMRACAGGPLTDQRRGVWLSRGVRAVRRGRAATTAVPIPRSALELPFVPVEAGPSDKVE